MKEKEMEKLMVEIDFDAEFVKRLENFFTEECIDREKWYKKAALKGIETRLTSWERRNESERIKIAGLTRSQDQREGTV
jgi:hypothetical protein